MGGRSDVDEASAEGLDVGRTSLNKGSDVRVLDNLLVTAFPQICVRSMNEECECR